MQYLQKLREFEALLIDELSYHQDFLTEEIRFRHNMVAPVKLSEL